MLIEEREEENLEQEVEKIKFYTIILRIGSIEAGPPLSTILGNHGINTVNFVKELNEFLNNCPNYFFLRIKITIFISTVSRYVFEVVEPSLFQCLKVISFKKVFKQKVKGKYEDVVYKFVNLKDIYFVCFLKYGYVNDELLKTVFSSIKSSNLKIYDDNF